MRKRSNIKPLFTWLNTPDSLIHYYHTKSATLNQLNCLWRKNVVSSLAAHTLVANLEQNILVIQADNANWASRLRYFIPQLLPQLKTWPMLKSLKEVTWYVASFKTMQQFPEKPTTVIALLSSENRDLIQSASKSISHPDLKLALTRLAKHSSFPNN